MSDIDRVIHELAASQHGAFTRAQARQRGITRQMLSVRLRRGDLRSLGQQVLVAEAAPDTELLRAAVATLVVPGAALSHRSAAGYWRLPGFRLEPLEVLSCRPGRAVPHGPLARIHTTTSLPDTHLTIRQGLVVTVPARVLFDLAPLVHPLRLERLIDAAWRMRLVTGRLLRRTLAELAGHGRPGIQIMRELIEARGDAYRATDSNAESRFEQLMAQVGVRTFERQVDVGDLDWLGRVDFRDREVPLIVEVDSEIYHASISDRAHDDARRAAIRQAGYRVLIVSDFDLWHRPRSVQEQVLIARRTA